MAQGFGLSNTHAPNVETASMPTAAPDAQAQTQTDQAQESVQGQVLEAVQAPVQNDSRQHWALALMLLLVLGGGLQQALVRLPKPRT